MKKLIRGLTLYALSSMLLLQCSKEDGDNTPSATQQEEVSIATSDLSASINENPAQGAAL